LPEAEGLTIPAAVNYVAKGADLYDLGYVSSGATSVVGRYVSASYLWDKVRVQGGAYGGSCSFDRRSGPPSSASPPTAIPICWRRSTFTTRPPDT